jgi:hypothetical protein
MISYYVAIDGDDRWSGTLDTPAGDGTDGPFATLARARDAVREQIAGGLREEVTVLLRGGVHEIAETVIFGPADAGGDRAVTYAAYPHERPVLSAGRPVTGWEKLSHAVPGLSDEAARQVWVARVPPGERFFCLFDGDERLPRARAAGFAPEAPGVGEDTDLTTLRFPPGRLRNWPNLADVELVVRPQHVWTVNILGLAAVDEAAGVATTALPATYPLVPLGQAWRVPAGTPSAWVENVPEALTQPGEWLLDSGAGLLYLWPRGDRPGADLRRPLLREVIRVEGDEEGGQLVHNLAFRGLTFAHGDRDLWTAADAGLQHDWELYDKANALVRLRGAEGCAVEHCRFTCSGGTGLRLDFHCQGNRVVANEFAGLGAGGVLLCGYGPGTRDVNKQNEVVDNDIHHCGEIYWHAPGIFVWQSGANWIAHNRLHHLPYSGIVISGVRPGSFTKPDARECGRTIRFDEIAPLPSGGAGAPIAPAALLPFLHARDNLVEYNEVHDVMERLGDGNGIYVSGAGHGNLIRRNRVHHLHAPGVHSAIRIDDWQEGTTIAENLVHDCVGGGITLKHVNRIENNIIATLLPKPAPEGGQPSPPSYILLRRGPVAGATIQRNLLYHTGGLPAFYDEGFSRWAPAYARECDTDYNLYYCAEDPAGAAAFLAAKREEGIDAHSVAVDPRFADPERGDFTLRPESPAFALGFQPLDLSRVGPRPPGERARQGVEIVNPSRDPRFQDDSADPAALARAGGTR